MHWFGELVQDIRDMRESNDQTKRSERHLTAWSLAVLLSALAFILISCIPGIYHVVGRDETLFRIAKTYEVSQDAIIHANKLKNPELIREGQYLFIPRAMERKKVAAYSPPAPPAPQKETPAAPGSPVQSPGKKDEPSPGIREADLSEKTRQPEPAQPTAAPQPSKTSDNTAPVEVRRIDDSLPKGSIGQLKPIWPARGTVTRHFGTADGQHHDGLDISGVSGMPIVAAGTGRVMYSGSLKGYGKVILIKHDQVYSTLYAHNRKNLVNEGQMVRQGQPIAEMGKSGRATGVHLHFEILENRKPVNPLKFLPKR